MAIKSFLIHLDSLDVLDELDGTDDEKLIQAGKLLHAFRDYHLGKQSDFDIITKIMFSPFKNQFIRDGGKYQKTVERNRMNGRLGGRPPKNPIKPTRTQKTQDNPVKPKKPTGLIPTYEEFLEYAKTKSKNLNEWKVKLKFESWKENNWKDGHHKPIKNWKTKLLNTLEYLQDEKGTNNTRTAGTYSRSQAISESETLFDKNS